MAYLRESEESVVVVEILDAAGTLLVRTRLDSEEFQVSRDEIMTAREKHSCGCCG